MVNATRGKFRCIFIHLYARHKRGGTDPSGWTIKAKPAERAGA